MARPMNAGFGWRNATVKLLQYAVKSNEKGKASKNTWNFLKSKELSRGCCTDAKCLVDEFSSLNGPIKQIEPKTGGFVRPRAVRNSCFAGCKLNNEGKQYCYLQMLQKSRKFSSQTASHSLSDADPFTSVKQELLDMQKDIKEELKTRIGLLEDCSCYYFDGKGKQIRPTTIFLAGKLCNMHTHKKSTLSSGQKRIAMISEMIHTASLLHDDVIDEATTRRGKESVNMVFTDKQSILAGDYILSKASIALARIGSCRAVELIAEIIEDLVKGEIMQLFIDDNPSKRFDDYIEKTYRKTASLIANSCKAVAVLGECDEDVQDIVFRFGKNIGIAFQLVDDALDFTSSPSELGKPVAADLSLGLATAPVLYATEHFPELEHLIMRRFSEPEDVAKAFQFVKNSNGIERTMALATEYINKAIRLIELLEPSQERECLIDLAKFVVKRTK